jgi:hypothetical protein
MKGLVKGSDNFKQHYVGLFRALYINLIVFALAVISGFVVDYISDNKIITYRDLRDKIKEIVLNNAELSDIVFQAESDLKGNLGFEELYNNKADALYQNIKSIRELTDDEEINIGLDKIISTENQRVSIERLAIKNLKNNKSFL